LVSTTPMSMRDERISDPDIACGEGVERGEREARNVRAGRGPRSAARRGFFSVCRAVRGVSGNEHAHLVEHLVPDAPPRNGALCLAAVAMADSSAPSLFTIAIAFALASSSAASRRACATRASSPDARSAPFGDDPNKLRLDRRDPRASNTSELKRD
jgi:hypothetical protein